MKVAIVYHSLSGNTKELAELIATEIRRNGGECDLFNVGRFAVNFVHYDIVLFGCYTWGDGKLPLQMRNELRRILFDEKQGLTKAAVFGTGDTQYHFYCRAVDEMKYHLQKHGVEVIGNELKVEQFVQGKQRINAINWINQILGELSCEK